MKLLSSVSPLVGKLSATLFLGLVVSTSTGCGALGAMANPKVAWAVTDPAPMNIVVRRADAAAATSKEVDRLLTSTPASPDSDWMAKVGPSTDDTKTLMKTVGDMPVYKQSKARIVASEVWVRTLPGVRSDNGQYPSLLAVIDTSLADSYAKIMAKKQEVADLKASRAEEDAAASAKDVSDDDKKVHKTKISALDKQISDAEDAVSPLQKDFLKEAKAKSSQTSADVKKGFGGAFVNLRQAVEDAEIANGAAAVRYPMAVPGIQGAVKSQVSVIVADILEEKTGTRPTLANLKLGIGFDGSSPTVTIAGLTSTDLGKISVGDLTTETLNRTKDWMGHALGLLGDISKTKEVLGFEEDVLDAVLEGFKTGAWQAPTATTIDTSAAAMASLSVSTSASATATTSATTATTASATTATATPATKATKAMAKKRPTATH